MEALFSRSDIHQVKMAQEQSLIDEIDRLSDDEIANTSVEDWCEYFKGKFSLEPPELSASTDDIEMDHNQGKVEVRGGRNRFFYDVEPGQSMQVQGHTLSFKVPFDGDPNLFYVRPSRFTSVLPRAEVRSNALVVTYQAISDEELQAIEQGFERDLRDLQGYLESLSNDAKMFNDSIAGIARKRLSLRLEKLQKANSTLSKFKYKLKKRNDAPKTFAVPKVKKKVVARPKSKGRKAEELEPALDEKTYEELLGVIRHMVTMIERSPATFRGIKEEALRDHFLVQLNGQYEGKASGETFNGSGKTDILVRENNKNIFIAECKFWKGPKSFADAIDQLLGYTSWRDTKTALLVFNRQKNLTTVLEQIPGLASNHPNFVKTGKESSSETEFHYVFHHNDDEEKHMLLAVLVFEVPD